MRFVLSLLLLCSFTVQAAELPGIPQFIDEMVVKHQFSRDELEKVFARAQHRPEVIEAISRPATIKPWLEYRAAFVNSKRIQLGLEFWNKYRQTLRRAEKKYGVPQDIIVAVIGVETIYGQNAGRFLVLDALTTLAFDYPRRADFPGTEPAFGTIPNASHSARLRGVLISPGQISSPTCARTASGSPLIQP